MVVQLNYGKFQDVPQARRRALWIGAGALADEVLRRAVNHLLPATPAMPLLNTVRLLEIGVGICISAVAAAACIWMLIAYHRIRLGWLRRSLLWIGAIWHSFVIGVGVTFVLLARGIMISSSK
jgi:hypothetical protein